MYKLQFEEQLEPFQSLQTKLAYVQIVYITSIQHKYLTLTYPLFVSMHVCKYC